MAHLEIPKETLAWENSVPLPGAHRPQGEGQDERPGLLGAHSARLGEK